MEDFQRKNFGFFLIAGLLLQEKINRMIEELIAMAQGKNTTQNIPPSTILHSDLPATTPTGVTPIIIEIDSSQQQDYPEGLRQIGIDITRKKKCGLFKNIIHKIKKWKQKRELKRESKRASKKNAN